MFTVFIAISYAANVSGTVRDPSKRAIAGAVVTVQSEGAATAITAQTDSQGRFAFDNLNTGLYVISASAPGFETAKQTIPVADQPLQLTFDLKIAEQETSVEVAGKRSALANSDKNYLILRNSEPSGSYKVENVVLKRDVATFTFRSGRFSILAPIAGRVVMVAFTGDGSFSLSPLIVPERNYVQHITGHEEVQEDFQSAVFCFTDHTYDELKTQWQSVDEPSGAKGALSEFHNRMRRRTDTPRSMLEAMLSSENVTNVEADLTSDVYNSVGGSFSAYIHGRKHSDLRFIVRATGATPFLPSPEEVALINFDPGGEQEGIWYLSQRWMMLGGGAFKFAEFIQEVTPHEIAHQWWGHLVGWSSYHDQWLSEGFADFSAGLFLQMTKPKSDDYKKYWDRARQAIVEKNNFGIRATDAGPLWMGLRLNTFKTARAYNRIVYPKGGYVLHMLRYLMFDKETGDRDFIDMMHDFTKTYANRNASTEDFKLIAEKHIKPAWDLTGNGRLDWFFGEWVFGTEVPRYRLEYSLEPADGGNFEIVGKLTQSDVSERFAMAVPIYLDFDGKLIRAVSLRIAGSATRDFKIKVPKKPKRVLVNAYDDVLASESVVKQM